MSTSTPAAVSDREAEVLAALGEHLTNAEIAARLYISVRTVESHVSSLLRKFGVSDRRALAAVASAGAEDEVGADGPDGEAVVLEADLGGASLPTTPTSFIGRTRELAAVRDAIAEHPLVTLVGPGGAGKTRLAVQVASDRPAVFADLAVLAADADTDDVARAVSRQLPMVEPARRPTDAVARHLASSPCLLVLDNCEHLLDGAATFAAVVADIPGTHVLATSRERLAVAAEVVVPVGPVELADAVDLFVQRAHAADPEVVLDPDLVESLCERLDRIPLAIELAAARLGAIDIVDLSDRFDDALDLLGGGDRTNRRHRSIRATIEWSHELLEPDAQALHRRLSVLRGPFRLAVAEAIGGSDGSSSVVLQLTQLVDASLLERRGGRYRQLELVRADAAERLGRADDRSATVARFVDWAIEAAADDLVEGDENDLLAAVRWAEQVDHPGLGTLAARLAPQFEASGSDADAQRLYEAAARATGDPALALAGAELACSRWQGDLAIAMFHLAAELGDRRDDPAAVAIGLAASVEVAGRFAGSVRVIPPLEECLRLVEEAKVAAARADDPDGCVAARVAIAEAFTDMGALDGSADPRASSALALAERSGDPILISSALDAMTIAQMNAGEVRASVASIERRFAVLGEPGDDARAVLERIDNLLMAADGMLRTGDFEASLSYSRTMRDIEVERGFLHSGLSKVANALFFLCEWDECLEQVEILRASWEREGRVRAGWIGTPFGCAAAILGYRGDVEQSARWFGLSAAASEASPKCYEVQRTLAADVHLHHGRRQEAYEILTEPLPLYLGWWPGLTAAVRGEAMGPAAIDEARPTVVDDPFSIAILDRAAGHHAAAVAGFETCGSRYQAARTWLTPRSGASAAQRRSAEATYRSLGLAVPDAG